MADKTVSGEIDMFQSLTGFPGHSDVMSENERDSHFEVSIPNGLPRPFRLRASTIACQAAKSNTFRQVPFWCFV